jgi:plastocyanin
LPDWTQRVPYDPSMNRATILGAFVLVLLSGCSSNSKPDEGRSPNSDASVTTPAACTQTTAKATDRAQISKSGIDSACVRVPKGGSFTLLNVDAKAHSFTTTKSSPVQLQVDLKKGSAFPYRFRRAGTYTLEDKASDLTLTIIVN